MTKKFAGLEEMAEVTEEHWEYLERRVLEMEEKAREGYRRFMTAVPEPDHSYRDSVIVAAISCFLLAAVLAGALLIWIYRIN